jgi:hypothetical protein
VGERAGGFEGERLDGALTLGASVVWEPDDRRWSFGLALDNLTDTDYQIAPGVEAAGLTALAMVERRW